MASLKISLFAALLAAVSVNAAAADDAAPPLMIGTGGQSGVYFPVGGAICRYLNAIVAPGERACRISESQGSLDNLRALHEGRVDLAIVQSDVEAMAYRGTSALDAAPMKELRGLFPLYVEALAIMVRADDDIDGVEDLKGRIVNAGPDGSGSSQTFHRVADGYGFDVGSLDKLDERSSSDAVDALCRRELDAVFFVSGHPNALVKRATETCDIQLVPVAPEISADLAALSGYYVTVSIPDGLYHGMTAPVPTIGTQAVLVAKADLPDPVAHRVASTILSEWSSFIREHPALRTFADQIGPSSGLNNFVPTHSGVARLFAEVAPAD